MSATDDTVYNYTVTEHHHKHKITSSVWFWVGVAFVAVIVIGLIFLLVYFLIHNTAGDNTSTNLRTTFKFSTTNNFPIVTFANLDIPTDTTQPITSPLRYNGITVSVPSSNRSSFIGFNVDGVQGPGLQNGNGTLIINFNPTVQAVALRLVELSGSPATITVTVTASDKTTNTTSVNVGANAIGFIGIVANLSTIQQITLNRTGSTGSYGFTDLQYGVYNS